MAIKAALVLAQLGIAIAQINTEKYTAVGDPGACRGNGGSSDRVNSKYKLGLTQAECETECDSISTCLGYAYQTGAASLADAYCIIYGPEVATFTVEGWEGEHATTHIDGANGNSAYTCYDIDLTDHEATCINGPEHASYYSGSPAVGYSSGCAATWTDTYYANCANIEGCPTQTCGGDATAMAGDPYAYCCEDSDCSGGWHYCNCQRDFEAGGKEESACDIAAGCVYTAAPVMETAPAENPGDALGCSNVYTPMSGACRGTDPTTGAQVGVNAKGSKGCDIDGKQKACGGTGQPTCEMTQEECEAGCAAENAIAPGRCEAYHWAPGGWCTIHGPHVHEGIGWDATAGAAAADSCWSYFPADVTEVTGTNTNTEYMCYMLNDKTVNNVCGSNTCENTCMYANDGDCDDGQPGSKYSICACGTDCSDCGSRASCDTSKSDWGTGNGWCSSDLDDHVGDTSTASACWTMCENTYGSDLTAIDWTPDGECYCQDECQCMEDADDGDIHLITSSAVASLPNTCVSACPAEEAAFQTCLSMQWPLDDDYFADDDDDDEFSPNTCADVQEWLSKGECADGPSVCRAEYNAWVECHYEDMAREELGQACDFTCSATCLGQMACDWDGSPCAADEFCNFDGGSYGSCEKCSDEDHCDRGLPSKGETDCEACCGIKKESNRDNVMLLILIIVCSVAGVCCLLALGTAAAFGAFGSCACFAKKKKTPTRVAEPSAPSAPVPLAVAEYYAAPPPMSPGTLAKTQEHIRRTAALMAEAPPSPGPPPLAPIKATETPLTAFAAEEAPAAEGWAAETMAAEPPPPPSLAPEMP